MTPINWRHAIGSLIAAGLTQPQIAQRCDCGQSTISDILNGKTADPRTSLGLRLIALCREHGVELWPERADAPVQTPQEAA